MTSEVRDEEENDNGMKRDMAFVKRTATSTNYLAHAHRNDRSRERTELGKKPHHTFGALL